MCLRRPCSLMLLAGARGPISLRTWAFLSNNMGAFLEFFVVSSATSASGSLARRGTWS